MSCGKPHGRHQAPSCPYENGVSDKRENHMTEEERPEIEVPEQDLNSLIQSLKDLLGLKKNIKKNEDQINLWKLTVTNLEEAVFNLMSASGIQNLTIKLDGQNYNAFQKSQVFYSAIPMEKEAAWKWLKENGYENLFKESINARTLNSALNERNAETEECDIPTNLFNKFDRDSVGFRKG